MPSSYWSIIEFYTAIVCLNMPSIRLFFKNTILPRCKSCTTVTRSSTTYYYGGGGGGGDGDGDHSPARVLKHPPRSLGRSILSSLTTSSSTGKAWGFTTRNRVSGSGSRAGDESETSEVQLVGTMSPKR